MRRSTTGKPDAGRAGRDLAAFARARRAQSSTCKTCRHAGARELLRATLQHAIDHPHEHRGIAWQTIHAYVVDRTGVAVTATGMREHAARHDPAIYAEWLKVRYAE